MFAVRCSKVIRLTGFSSKPPYRLDPGPAGRKGASPRPLRPGPVRTLRMGETPPRFRRCLGRLRVALPAPSPAGAHEWRRPCAACFIARARARASLARAGCPARLSRWSTRSTAAMRLAGRSRPVGFQPPLCHQRPRPSRRRPTPTASSQVIDGHHPSGHVDERVLPRSPYTAVAGFCPATCLRQDFRPRLAISPVRSCKLPGTRRCRACLGRGAVSARTHWLALGRFQPLGFSS